MSKRKKDHSPFKPDDKLSLFLIDSSESMFSDDDTNSRIIDFAKALSLSSFKNLNSDYISFILFSKEALPLYLVIDGIETTHLPAKSLNSKELDRLIEVVDEELSSASEGIKKLQTNYEAALIIAKEIIEQHNINNVNIFLIVGSDWDMGISPIRVVKNSYFNNGMNMYTISLGSQINTRILEEIAKQGNGAHLEPKTIEDVLTLYETINNGGFSND